MTVLLNGMEKKGYIERRNVGNNRRSLYVYLTDKGREYADRLNREFAVIEAEALKGFSEKETEQVQELLNRIYNNMTNYSEKEGIKK